ncbi:MAG TPA: isoprenylcysteine carboxylmethyltransferase family protein [Chryseolinea sp.]|nr:isoprenylcysteine carboxylmethyltransferase family protein [Chryseolinea sp.]
MTSLLIATYCLWILSEISLSLFRRSEKSDNKNADKGTLGLIWVIIIIANSLAYNVSGSIDLPISTDPAVRYLGLALIMVGMILRLTVVASLGKFFTVNVTILKDHVLKQDGFYKFIRHPSYSASLLSFVGYGVSLNNWISLVIVTSAALTAFLIRIRIEEKTLTDHFGYKYIEYKKRTKRLIPFVY